MKITRLAPYLAEQTGMNIDLANQLVADQKVLSIPRGELLLKKGDIAPNFYFVEQGLLRYYFTDSKGKEHIVQFTPQNWFVGDRESIFSGKPAQFFVQALEDSTVVLLDESFVVALFKYYPDFTGLNNLLLHDHISHLHSRVNQLLSYSAEERYLSFMDLYPDISSRISQTMIASYLGITPESLSRVKKELSRKKQAQQQ